MADQWCAHTAYTRVLGYHVTTLLLSEKGVTREMHTLV
jgi:hypothetical protein